MNREKYLVRPSGGSFIDGLAALINSTPAGAARSAAPQRPAPAAPAKPRLNFLEQAHTLAKEKKITLAAAIRKLAIQDPQLHRQYLQDSARNPDLYKGHAKILRERNA